MATRHVDQRAQVRLAEHATTRITGIVDDDGPSAGVDARLEYGQIDLPVALGLSAWKNRDKSDEEQRFQDMDKVKEQSLTQPIALPEMRTRRG